MSVLPYTSADATVCSVHDTPAIGCKQLPFSFIAIAARKLGNTHSLWQASHKFTHEADSVAEDHPAFDPVTGDGIAVSKTTGILDKRHASPVEEVLIFCPSPADGLLPRIGHAATPVSEVGFPLAIVLTTIVIPHDTPPVQLTIPQVALVAVSVGKCKNTPA